MERPLCVEKKKKKFSSGGKRASEDKRRRAARVYSRDGRARDLQVSKGLEPEIAADQRGLFSRATFTLQIVSHVTARRGCRELTRGCEGDYHAVQNYLLFVAD